MQATVAERTQEIRGQIAVLSDSPNVDINLVLSQIVSIGYRWFRDDYILFFYNDGSELCDALTDFAKQEGIRWQAISPLEYLLSTMDGSEAVIFVTVPAQTQLFERLVAMKQRIGLRLITLIQ